MSTVEGLTLVGLVVTLGIAIVGWVQANRAGTRADRANEHAETANRIAEEALELARSNDERAERLEVQGRESRDVRWVHLEDRDHSSLAFRNVGADEAHDVYLTVDPIYATWPRRREAHGTVAGGSRIAMNLATELQEEHDRWERDQLRRDSSFISVPSLDIRVRINWKSASGYPSSQEFDQIVL